MKDRTIGEEERSMTDERDRELEEWTIGTEKQLELEDRTIGTKGQRTGG